MKHTLIAVYDNSKNAEDAVTELKDMGLTKDISVMAKDTDDNKVHAHDVQKDLPNQAAKGATSGAIVGGVIGAIAGTVLAGVATLTLPGLGIALAGPIVAAFAGAGAGGAAGSLVGALTGLGVPEERAKKYEEYINKGEILVAVTAEPKDVPNVQAVLSKFMPTRENVEGESDRLSQYDMP